MAAFIVSYEEAVALGPTTAGGKGWNLGRLHRYGFAVPTGGILIAQAYTQFMQDPRVRALCADLAGVQIGDVADTEVADKLRALRVTIEATAFTAFLDEFGHRGVYEFELANPRWHENPSYLLDCVRGVSTQAMLTVPYELAQVKRQGAEAAVARLPLRLRLFVSWFAHQARRAAALREAGKSTLVALLEPIRAIVLEMGRRMLAAHLLEAKEDVFFLTWSDVLAFLRGEWDGQGAQALVADRKEQHAAWLTQMPADVFLGDPAGYSAASPVADEQGTEEAGVRQETRSGRSEEPLHGIAASPGQVGGRARILYHPAEGRNLQAGEVLVAPSTDPAWTPLFLRARAVVMETGGYLSHGAIVAREFGIPAVVNIPGLLKRVEAGHLLTVDGNRGLVTLGDVSLTLVP